MLNTITFIKMDVNNTVLSLVLQKESIFMMSYRTMNVINSSVPNAPARFSDVFRGVEKGCIGNGWVN